MKSSKLLLLLTLSLAVLGMTREEAIEIAGKGLGGLGTDAEPWGDYWVVTALYKSLKPEGFAVIDPKSKAIILGNNDPNGDQLDGTAEAGKGLAAFVLPSGLRIGVEGLKAWPKKLAGKKVHVTGYLRYNHDPKGLIATVTNAKYKLAP